MRISRYLPILEWARLYNSSVLSSDLVAALIVTIMLIPQSLAYAMLAGLPPVVGLYASITPLLAYAIFGTSRTLSVGPVAVVSLMTAAAISQIAEPGSAEYLGAAMALALLSGLFLLLMGLMRLGFIANFLSHPVISGFITASGILIAASQFKHILGISASGHSLLEMIASIASAFGEINIATLWIGGGAIGFLFFVRSGLKHLLISIGVHPRLTELMVKTGPVAAVIVTSLCVVAFDLEAAGVHVVGDIPKGLPAVKVPSFDSELWRSLIPASILISLIGFVESVSVGQTLAAKRRHRIDPDQELVGLGAANIASAVSGGFPVTGGFSRSVVNFDAGAQTPAAGAFTAIGIALTTLFFTPLFKSLPIATLAATIIVAVLGLVDLKALGRTWIYSKSDFTAMITTILVTLAAGVEAGVMTGVTTSIFLHLYRSSRPHIAIVGIVPGTEHFRNIKRHKVICSQKVLSLRIDESLYFANARFLEDIVYDLVARNPSIEHLVLMCSAVNSIDGSALEGLEAINERLRDAGVQFHISEIKGPVMDRLRRSHLIDDLTGEVFLSQYAALVKLDPETARSASHRNANQGNPYNMSDHDVWSI